MKHTATSYNFMSENAPVEHQVRPQVENARNMNADFNRVDGKYSFHQGVLSGSPLKPPRKGQDQFKSSSVFSREPENKGRQEQKHIPDKKTRDLQGSDPISFDGRPKNKESFSPQKQARAQGYMNSGGMADTLKYKDADVFSGLVDTKGASAVLFQQNAQVKKESWKPKAKAKWVEDPKQPLTL